MSPSASLRALPSERLVERLGTVEVCYSEGDDADSLLHGSFLRQGPAWPVARQDRCAVAGVAPRSGRRVPPIDSAHIPPLEQPEKPVARVVVDVMLKPEILDPQGQAVLGALTRLGHSDIASVRQGKRFEIVLDATPDAAALDQIASTLLANTVIEDYTIHVEES